MFLIMNNMFQHTEVQLSLIHILSLFGSIGPLVWIWSLATILRANLLETSQRSWIGGLIVTLAGGWIHAATFTVSYTHLDVYKRQRWFSLRSPPFRTKRRRADRGDRLSFPTVHSPLCAIRHAKALYPRNSLIVGTFAYGIVSKQVKKRKQADPAKA